MGNLVIPIWVVAGIAAVLVLGVAVFMVRRLVLARSRASFDCSLRPGMAEGEGTWTSGVASYGTGELHWYRLFSLSPRPSLTWARATLTITRFGEPGRGEVFAVLPGAVVVTCRSGDDDMQLAMSMDAYTGFASWLESAPPGPRARVT